MKDQKYQFIRGENGKINIAGFGSYGEVKLARRSETNQIVAIKMIYNRNAKQQIDVHHKLNHPNIIKLLNYNYEKQKNITYMVLEYAENGTLSDKIRYGLGQLPKKLIKRYFKDVCEAVRYLHINNYMHRDIKPENILLTKQHHAKLCDFGFAAILEYRSTLCGTHQYMSPEMIQKRPYDYKIDIWALGILLFQMINGTAPFRGQKGQEVLAQMKKPIVFSNRFEHDQIDLIRKILRVNSENRPTIQQILEHKYFKDNNDLDIQADEEEEQFKKKSNHSHAESHISQEIKQKKEGFSLEKHQMINDPHEPKNIANSCYNQKNNKTTMSAHQLPYSPTTKLSSHHQIPSIITPPNSLKFVSNYQQPLTSSASISSYKSISDSHNNLYRNSPIGMVSNNTISNFNINSNQSYNISSNMSVQNKGIYNGNVGWKRV